MSGFDGGALPKRTLFALWNGDFAALSRLLAVADACAAHAEPADQGVLSSGQLVVVVRIPGARPEECAAVASLAAPLIRAADAHIGVNVGGPERGESLAVLLRRFSHLQPDWLQVPERAEFRREDIALPSRILRSCHDARGLEAAFAAGADACTLSPIWPTASKVGHPGVGLAKLTQACVEWPGAIVALGGVDGARASAAFASGAAGIAALSAPWGAEAANLVASLVDR